MDLNSNGDQNTERKSSNTRNSGLTMDRLQSQVWEGQLGSNPHPYMRFSDRKVILYFPASQQLTEGDFTLDANIVQLAFRGPLQDAGGSHDFSVEGNCRLKHDPHPYLFQDYLDCTWTKQCKSQDHLKCSILTRNHRFYDPNSHKPPGEKIRIGEFNAVTVGLQKATLKTDAFVRVAPDINAAHLKGFVECGKHDPERYSADSPFTMIGRTQLKDRLLDTEDYWYYGIVWPGYCNPVKDLRYGWIFGSMLE